MEQIPIDPDDINSEHVSRGAGPVSPGESAAGRGGVSWRRPTAVAHALVPAPAGEPKKAEPGLIPDRFSGFDATGLTLSLGDTPAEFKRVLTGLERISRIDSDVSSAAHSLVDSEWPYIMGITSAVAGEGKTTTAIHLALTLARCTPKRICLIDLSLGNNDLAQRLGMPGNTDNLINAIEGQGDIIPYFVVPDCDNLTIVPSGPAPVNASKFARRPRVGQFLNAARRAFDVVIVDMPAVSTENVLPLARQMDGVMVVIRAGVTPKEVVADAIRTVGHDRVKCAILNRSRSSTPSWLRKRFGVA